MSQDPENYLFSWSWFRDVSRHQTLGMKRCPAYEEGKNHRNFRIERAMHRSGECVVVCFIYTKGEEGTKCVHPGVSVVVQQKEDGEEEEEEEKRGAKKIHT